MKAVVFVSVLSASTMRVCGEDPPPPPPPPPVASATVVAEVELPPPAHGGEVVFVEDRPVEVVVQNDGEVHAWVVHPAPPPPDFQMVVNVHGDDGAVHPVQLAWNAEAEVYAGRLVEVRPAPGPVEVHVAFAGRVRRAHIARVRVVRPRFSVFVDHDVDVHVEGPGRRVGHVRGRGPHGRVDVHVHGPTPPPPPHVSVRIEGPVPPPPPRLEVSVGARVEGDVHVKRRGRRGRRHRPGRH